jgi:hypothetical protein
MAMPRAMLFMGSLVVAGVFAVAAEDRPNDPRALIRQLDAAQLTKREAAEHALLERGPAVLDLLPPITDNLSAEVRQRLGRIRRRLEDLAAGTSAEASHITLHAEAMPLGQILHAFEEQSGNPLVDFRARFGQPVTDPKLTLRFDKTPFWPALDQLLNEAGLAIYPHGRPGAISLVARGENRTPIPAGHVSYSGPFRIEPISIVAKRDVRPPGNGTLAVTLEAAWEPRLRLIELRWPRADVLAVGSSGDALPVVAPAAQAEALLNGRATTVQFDLPFELPSRRVERITRLQGKLVATVPGKLETFRFHPLAETKNTAETRNLEQRIAGVTVSVNQIQKHRQGWEVCIRARFDDAGDALASHRQWVFDNSACLESPGDRPLAFDTFETTAQGKNEVGVAYVFKTERPLRNLTFVYKTPGTLVTQTHAYELKDLELP